MTMDQKTTNYKPFEFEFDRFMTYVPFIIMTDAVNIILFVNACSSIAVVQVIVVLARTRKNLRNMVYRLHHHDILSDPTSFSYSQMIHI